MVMNRGVSVLLVVLFIVPGSVAGQAQVGGESNGIEIDQRDSGMLVEVENGGIDLLVYIRWSLLKGLGMSGEFGGAVKGGFGGAEVVDISFAISPSGNNSDDGYLELNESISVNTSYLDQGQRNLERPTSSGR